MRQRGQPQRHAGPNDSHEGAATTGGSSFPTLTCDLAICADNLDPVNILALSMEDGGALDANPDPQAITLQAPLVRKAG